MTSYPACLAIDDVAGTEALSTATKKNLLVLSCLLHCTVWSLCDKDRDMTVSKAVPILLIIYRVSL